MKQITNWSPLYFLAALGAGGMVITFFMFLMFWVPHTGQPIPVFNDWVSYFQMTNIGNQALIIFALAGIIIFGYLHFWWLLLNFKNYRQYTKSGDVEKIIGTNAHTQLLAMPLAYAMSINVSFLIAAVFIPGLWNIIEWLFPISIMIFVLLGIWASRIYLSFFGHILEHGSFDNSSNNSLAQLLPSFAFVMIGVGLSAPAALSNNKMVIAISCILALFFITTALLLGLIKLIIGMNDMFKEGASLASLPTLWVIIPILTTAAIAILRVKHGLHTLELSHAGSNFILLVTVFSLQIMFVLMGLAVMKRMNYFKLLLDRKENSPVVFALICPGVALVVSGHFFINNAMVASGIISKFDVVYVGLSFFLIVLQLMTGWLLVRLARDHFK